MNRRDALKNTLRLGAVAALAPLGSHCQTGTSEKAALPTELITVDGSFARLLAKSLQPDGAHQARLLEHPALAAVLRHQRLAGNQSATREVLLKRIVDSLQNLQKMSPSVQVLQVWAGRERELSTFVHAAGRYLPGCLAFGGTLFFIMGYDIGAAAPPDILLNVAHPHFLNAPSEIGFYATHEAHHVGFLAVRKPPELIGLNVPQKLLRVIQYMTQLEGMAVHAAYPLRKEKGALHGDDDYRIYVDPSEAQRVTRRYAELTSGLSTAGPLSDEAVGHILGAMSSNERIWYRFGALVAWTLERAQGRDALVNSIARPNAYLEVAAQLLG